MKFRNEAEMSKHFRTFFSPIVKTAEVSWAEELDGLFGVPDYVFLKLSRHKILYVVALELKLRDWKKGLLQAFKYRNFANESYVVLDSTYIDSASKHIDEFKRANIGLTSFNRKKEFSLHFAPEPSIPFSIDFSFRMVRKYVEREHRNINNNTTELPIPFFARSIRARKMLQASLPRFDFFISSGVD